MLKTPNLVYLNVELGFNFEKQKQSDIAKTFYEKALKSIDKNMGMGGYIGRLFKEKSLLNYAIAAYEKIMLLNPNTNYKFQIAQIFGEQGNFEKMFIAYVDLIDKNEQYLNTVQQYASRYITDDKLNTNNILFKKALLRKSVSNPKDVWNQLLSWLFVQQKEYSKAFIQEKALFNRNPKYLQNILNLSFNSFENKAFETAKKCFEFIKQNSLLIDQKVVANLYLIKIAIETQPTKY